MKILYIITKSNFGGAQKNVFDLATAMQGRGHTVTVASGGTGTKSAQPGILFNHLKALNIRSIFIKNFVRDMFILSDIKAFFELLVHVYKEKPDVLHVTSSKAGGMGVVVGRLCGTNKIIFTSHGLAYNESWRPMWQRTLIKLFTWLTILLSHKSIMISAETSKEASSLPFCKNKVELIYNGIGEPKYDEKDKSRHKLREIDNSLNVDALWIGSVAELHPNKNLGLLLEAVASVKAQLSNIEIVVIGEGELREKLLQKAEQLGIRTRVHLLGFVDDASKYLKAFDIFVLPSKKEGLPYVLLEAGAAKLPVIASDLPGIRDIVDPNVSGVLVSLKKETLATAIVSLMNNEEARFDYGEMLYKKIATTFSLKKMIDETEQLYIATS